MTKRFDNNLPQVKIASPCPANWDEMEGDDRTRFCGQCRLNVHNVSDMSASEARAFLEEATGRVCVRFYARADGTVLTRDCPVGFAAVRRRAAMTVSAVAALAMMAVSVVAGGRARSDDPVRERFQELKTQARDIEPFKSLLNAIDPPPPSGPPMMGNRVVMTGALAPPPPPKGP